MPKPKQCKTLKQLHRLHAHSIITGLFFSSHNIPNLFLHSFISLFPTIPTSSSSSSSSSSSLLSYALSLFNLIPNPSTFSFNNIIRAQSLLLSSSPLPPLFLFSRMRHLSLSPDFHTFPFLLKASAQLGLPFAQVLHSLALKFGFAADLFFRNTLIRVYSVSGRLDHAGQVFDESAHRDVVTYNVLIDGLVKAGDMLGAREMFDGMPVRDGISWGTILAGYVGTRQCDETIRLFDQMMGLELQPDSVALVSALSACAQLGDMERGRNIHYYIRQNGIRVNSFLATALVDFYAKCGCIEIARKIFDLSTSKNLFTWNAMLVGLAMHGRGQLCLDYFSRMIKARVQPDGVSFLGVLVGCSHAGLVNKAKRLFDEMESVYGVHRELKHYGCMADLLGRAGLIKEAMKMIKGMPMGGDVYVWGGLLGGCRIHGNVEIAKEAAENVMKVKPDDGGVYSIMANIYANAEQWDDVEKMRRSLDVNKRVIKKNAGCSLIRLDGITHEFVAGDGLHPQTDEIYFVLNGIEKHQFEAY